ncbi:hypothetical protein [uncultured Alistipes sp.]|uniref:hypothetical protein n=1 Tax=uncultured Alistipes sp. TaxID=538949 RepID=UPI0026279B96|nr:hypothetical protein [uncultured Alistipes sp.]
MYQISNADFEQLMRIFRALDRCRGSTNNEINALRKMKLLHRKWERKKGKGYL